MLAIAMAWPPDVHRRFNLSRLPWWYVVVVGSAVATLWTIITPALPDTEWLGLFKQTFNLGLELNLSVWWSSMLFFCAAALAFRLARTEGEDRLGWMGLAVVLAVLSLDELGSLHERAHDRWFYPIVGAVALLLAASLVRLALGGRTRAAALIAIAFGLFVFSSQVLEEVGTLDRGALIGAVRGIEEGIELLGCGLILLAAVMTLSEPRTMALRAFVPRLADESSRLVMLGLLAIGLVVLMTYIATDGRGDPGRWFVGAGFLVVAGTLQWDRSRGDRAGLASLVAVAASIDVCYHLYDVPGAERVMPEDAQHLSGLLIAATLWVLAHDRLRSVIWSVAALSLPALGILLTPLSDSHRLHHVLALCTAAVWVTALSIRAADRLDERSDPLLGTGPAPRT